MAYWERTKTRDRALNIFEIEEFEKKESGIYRVKNDSYYLMFTFTDRIIYMKKGLHMEDTDDDMTSEVEISELADIEFSLVATLHAKDQFQ